MDCLLPVSVWLLSSALVVSIAAAPTPPVQTNTQGWSRESEKCHTICRHSEFVRMSNGPIGNVVSPVLLAACPAHVSWTVPPTASSVSAACSAVAEGPTSCFCCCCTSCFCCCCCSCSSKSTLHGVKGGAPHSPAFCLRRTSRHMTPALSAGASAFTEGAAVVAADVGTGESLYCCKSRGICGIPLHRHSTCVCPSFPVFSCSFPQASQAVSSGVGGVSSAGHGGPCEMILSSNCSNKSTSNISLR